MTPGSAKLYSIGYLMLVSFALRISNIQGDQVEALKNSPYDGIAVIYVAAHGHAELDHGALIRQFQRVADQTGKPIWPWIFLNRIIGIPVASGDSGEEKDKSYFARIKGWDLFGDQGELAAFLDIWRGSLRAARAAGAPGIVFDPELYNNRDTQKVSNLAEQMDKSEDEVKAGLQSLGAKLADITAQEYPDAVIMSLFSGLTRQPFDYAIHDFDYRSYTYLTIGFLDRCKQKGYKLTLVSGGEIEMGYCYSNLKGMKKQIASQNHKYQPFLDEYPNLRTGAPLCPWADADKKTSWLLTNSACKNSQAAQAEDFLPYVQELLHAFPYVWIYGATASDYNPGATDADAWTRINNVLWKAKGTSSK
jgi:hypothetical protein